MFDMTSYLKMHFPYFSCPAAVDLRPAQRVDETDDDCEAGRPMDSDEERDYADHGRLDQGRPPGVVCAPSTLLQLHLVSESSPTGLKASVHIASHKEVSLVYFSTFEPIGLNHYQDSIMQRAGVPMLYDSASNPRLPCLYNESTSAQRPQRLGRAPSLRASESSAATVLNSHPTIPLAYRFSFKDDLMHCIRLP
jgi:hypothetical protein